MLDEHPMLDCCKLREDLQKATAAQGAAVTSKRNRELCFQADTTISAPKRLSDGRSGMAHNVGPFGKKAVPLAV
jgi:hypothetical protein